MNNWKKLLKLTKEIHLVKVNLIKPLKILNYYILNLEENVENKTGLKVKIYSKKNNSGTVVFEYKEIDQLNHLLMVIKANY